MQLRTLKAVTHNVHAIRLVKQSRILLHINGPAAVGLFVSHVVYGRMESFPVFQYSL